jgi:hypothetical protein
VQGRGVSPLLERNGTGGAQRRSAQAKRGRLARRLARARGQRHLRRLEDRVLFRRLLLLVDGFSIFRYARSDGICLGEPKRVAYDNPTYRGLADVVVNAASRFARNRPIGGAALRWVFAERRTCPLCADKTFTGYRRLEEQSHLPRHYISKSRMTGWPVSITSSTRSAARSSPFVF